MLQGKKIVLGVTGGVAIFKSVQLVSNLRKQGAEVRVVMTDHAQEFITPLMFAEISGNKVATSMWDKNQEFHVEHIALANWADCYLIAPATANIIAKMANGIADDLLSTTLLAATCPVIVCPAMNTNMYENAATQANLATLASRGVTIMEPNAGFLACGVNGKGRMPEPIEIQNFLDEFFAKREGDMRGLKVLVTAAGTREPIDPVRFVGNRSSGKMGYAVAEMAASRGADVILVSGPSALKPPANVKVINVETTCEMLEACLSAYDEVDIVIKAAAVADYRPLARADQKIKKSDDDLKIELGRNPDILKYLGEHKTHQKICGFAMETENVLSHAREKFQNKNCDMLVLNDLNEKGAGFKGDTNVVTFITSKSEEKMELMSKEELSYRILYKLMEV